MAHAWKACLGLYPNEGSNPSLSAIINELGPPKRRPFFTSNYGTVDQTSSPSGGICKRYVTEQAQTRTSRSVNYFLKFGWVKRQPEYMTGLLTSIDRTLPPKILPSNRTSIFTLALVAITVPANRSPLTEKLTASGRMKRSFSAFTEPETFIAVNAGVWPRTTIIADDPLGTSIFIFTTFNNNCRIKHKNLQQKKL